MFFFYFLKLIYYLATFPNGFFLPVLLDLADMAVELHWAIDIKSFDFPRISVIKPVVRHLYLVTILNQLSENTIVVSDAIPPSWEVKSCH